MSILPRDTVASVAESIGSSLDDDAAALLLQDTEYRIREIVHEAAKFMRCARRARLTAADVNSALAVRNVEPLYGFISGSPATFRIANSGSSTLFYLDDQELDLEDVINRPLPPVPVEVTYTAHWLAVDGVQPRIVQNPTPAELASNGGASGGMFHSMSIGGNNASTSASKTTAAAGVSSTPRRGERLPEGGRPDAPLVKEVLTKELQQYFDKVTEMLTSDSAELRSLAIDSISKDPGIQGLMPYLMQFIGDAVTRSLKQLEVLWTLMRFVRGLFANPNIDPEPYLHQLIPAVLTCVVAKRLSATLGEDHWSLRLYAAQIAAHMCVKYGASYHTLEPRVARTLLRAMLEAKKPLATVYGAIAALSALGKQVIQMLVVPNVRALVVRIATSTDAPHDIVKCRSILISALTQHFASVLSDMEAMDAAKSAVTASTRVPPPPASSTSSQPSQQQQRTSTSTTTTTQKRSELIDSLKDEWSEQLGDITDEVFEALASRSSSHSQGSAAIELPSSSLPHA